MCWISDLCSASDQRACQHPNSACNVEKGYCDCVDGFALNVNNECTPGRVCGFDVYLKWYIRTL